MLRSLFQLDRDVIFLNHGSFGATPRPVFEAYQAWQHRLEAQPVKFLGRELLDRMKAARSVLGDFMNAPADDLVFVPNATYGVNVVARSLNLGPDDEVLATDHEYGACDRTWQFLSQKLGFHYLRQPVPLPIQSVEALVEQIWQGVTPRTKLIFLSHITSSTAVQFPVEAICQRARAAGILTLVDGAHAPGQIPLDLTAVGADFYAGNCHKWLLSPKGAGFLYARPEVQPFIEPLVVSWGWGEERPFTTGSDFLDYLEWTGTHDPAAYLSVPAAIQFQAEHNWPVVRAQCHELLRGAIGRINQLTGLDSLYPNGAGYYHQMAAAWLPKTDDLEGFKNRLYDEYRIEIPLTQWRDKQLIRVSVQGYNTQADSDALLKALQSLLKNH